MARVVTQVAAALVAVNGEGTLELALALCDDHTLWRFDGLTHPEAGHWERLPDVPQDGAPAPQVA